MSGVDDGDEVAAALAVHLAGVSFSDRAADAVTGLLIDAVAGWAGGRGWRVYRRAASVVTLPPPMQHQHSVIDVAVARPGALPLAIEVDHGSRKRTVEKLVAEGAAGRVPILVRWGGRKQGEVAGVVRLITVDVDQHPGGRFSRGVVRPAPPHSGTGGGESVALPLDY